VKNSFFKLILFTLLVINLLPQDLYSQVQCSPDGEDNDRPVRLDSASRDMAPRNSQGRPIRGSLVGTKVASQDPWGNCYAHAASVVYQSLSRKNPQLSGLALSTCQEDVPLGTYMTSAQIDGGNLQRLFSCAQGKRYCLHNKGRRVSFEQQINLHKIDRGRGILSRMPEEKREKILNGMSLIKTELLEMGLEGNGDRHYENNCFKVPVGDNFVSFSNDCEERANNAIIDLVNIESIARNASREDSDDDNDGFKRLGASAQTPPSLDGACIKQDMSSLSEKMELLQFLITDEDSSDKAITDLKQEIFDEVESHIEVINNAAAYTKSLNDLADAFDKIPESIDEFDSGYEEYIDTFKGALVSDKQIILDLKKWKKNLRQNCYQGQFDKIDFTQRLCRVLDYDSDLTQNISHLFGPLFSAFSNMNNVTNLFNKIDPNVDKERAFKDLNKCQRNKSHKFNVPRLEGRFTTLKARYSYIKENPFVGEEFIGEMIEKLMKGNQASRDRLYAILNKFYSHNLKLEKSQFKNFIYPFRGCFSQTIRNKSGLECDLQKNIKGLKGSINRILGLSIYNNWKTPLKLKNKIGNAVELLFSTFAAKSPRDFERFINKPAKQEQYIDYAEYNLRSALDNVKDNRAISMNICAKPLSDSQTTSENAQITHGEDRRRCGPHAVAAIGYKCKGGKLKVLIQNSYGTRCSSLFPASGVECEKKGTSETGKFWIDESLLSKVTIGIETVSGE